MIDADDVGVGFMISIPVGIIFLILYFAFSVPEIDACHVKDGVIIRVEGKDLCVDKTVIKIK